MSSPQNEEHADVVYLRPRDEIANVVTHSIGFVLSLGAGVYFHIQTAQHALGLRLCCWAFCIALAAVYLFSTLSHAVYEPFARNRLRAWDQGTIYFLIVGTYSPFIWTGTSGTFRLGLLATVWIVAALGFYSKVLASYRINAVATVTYLALGWLPAIPLIHTTPAVCFLWMVVGGLCYSLGVVFLKMSARVQFSHAAWHIMVMLGSASHCWAIQHLLNAHVPLP